ncbi:hypothetical protein BG003_007104 [Podila horticola]|nr:hypothetical protein BG003_007104 [Podila horticola]
MPAPIEIQSPRLKQLHQQFSTSRQSTPLIQQYPHITSAFEFDSDFGPRVFPSSPLADNTRAREFETAFCRDFYCCGLVLVDLHDLLQHYEECHVRFEEDDDDLAEQESEFFDDDSWSDSDSAPSSPSSSSPGSGMSSSGSGTGSRSGSCAAASLGPYQSRRSHSPLPHHQTPFHGYHLHPLQSTDPNNSLLAPYHNSTTHALEAFSASYSGPNKRKAVVSLADIYAEDDNSVNLQGDASAFANTILRSRSTASAAEILGPMNKRQAVESNQRSIAASIFSDAASTTTSHLLMNKANQGASGPYHFNGASHLRPNNSLGLTGQISNPLGNMSIFPGLATSGRQGPQPPLGGLLTGRPSLFLTPGGTPASAMDLIRQRDEVFSMIEDMSKPNTNSSGDKPYRCTVLGCDKSYKNPNGLKYHNLHGHCSSSGLCGDDNPENKPYVCTFLECGKRYKNLNGLKYHIEHSHPNLIAALRAHHSGLTNPLLFGPYPNQAAMTIAAALAAVETSPMMLAAANAILTSASNAAAAANAASATSANSTGGGNGGSGGGAGGPATSGLGGGAPGSGPPSHVSVANMMGSMQASTPVVSIAPALPLVRTIKDVAVPIGIVGGSMTAVPTLSSLNEGNIDRQN